MIRRKVTRKVYAPRDVDEVIKERRALEAGRLHTKVVEEHDNQYESERDRVRKNLAKQAYMDKVRKLINAAVEKELSRVESIHDQGWLDYGCADDFVDVLRTSVREDGEDRKSESSYGEDSGDEGWEPYDHLLQLLAASSSSPSSSAVAVDPKVARNLFRSRGDTKSDPVDEFMNRQVKACQDSVTIESNELIDEKGLATFKLVCNLKTDQHFLLLNKDDQFMVLTRQKVGSTNTECKVVAKSTNYGKTVNGVLLENKTLVRFFRFSRAQDIERIVGTRLFAMV